MSNLRPEFILWQKVQLDLMRVGGTWIIPRTGTRVKKIAEDAVVIMYKGPEEQLEDYIRAAGYKIKVFWPTDN